MTKTVTKFKYFVVVMESIPRVSALDSLLQGCGFSRYHTLFSETTTIMTNHNFDTAKLAACFM